MRADTASARTWLLGAVAAWALCAWLLGLLGMGGHVDPLDEDPSLLQALPQAAKAPKPRLGPLAQYGKIARRPLFSDDRRPQPFVINPGDESAGRNGFDYVLTSVMIAPDFRMAILQPSEGGDPVRVKVGAAPETAPGWRLVSLEPRQAVFDGPEGERKLQLRVFDGEGGIPPTPSTAPAGESAGGPARRAPDMAGPAPPVRQQADSAEDADAAADAAQPAAEPAEKPDNRASAEQIEAIRQRIQERRAKLRQDAAEQARPGNKP